MNDVTVDMFPLVAEFVEALEDEADEKIPAERISAALKFFNPETLSAGIKLARETPVEGDEGNVYDFLCEGGSGDLDAYRKVVYGISIFVYVDAFANALLNW